MKLETFFEKFELFADAPNAVAKMRELVLELAVQGKLVSPSPKTDKHPAWVAFRKENSERINRDESGPPPFEIPDHWEWCVLNEVADCRAAAKVSPTDIRDTDWVLDLEDIDGTTGQIIQTATFAERRSLSTKAAFEPGDVLYGKLRPYLNKVVVATKQGYCTTEIIPLRPAAFLTSEFLRCYLRSQTFLRYAAQKNYGMKMPRLGTKDLESAKIPVPPPTEQKRIVAKVDELMALCDRLEGQQRERETRQVVLARAALARFADAPTPANLDFIFHPSYAISPADLRKAILALAVQGKLVPQDPDDEPANILIERIFAEKDELKRKKVIRTTSAHTLRDNNTDNYALPIGWSWVTLDDICDIGTGSTPLKSQREYYKGGTIPWVTSAATNTPFITAPEQYVTAKAVVECNLRMYPKGSLLVALYGQGKTRGQVAQLMFDSTTNQASAVIVFFGSGEGVRGYVRLFFLKKYDELREQAAGGAQPNLSGGMIRLTRIPIPPLAEQRRIVAKVDELMALVDALERQLGDARATAAKLLDALVAELTGTPHSGKGSVPVAAATGRRGRPPKA